MSTSIERLEYLMNQLLHEVMELRIKLDNCEAAIQSLNAGPSGLESNGAAGAAGAASGPNELPQAAPQIHIPSSIMPWRSQAEGDEE